MGHQAERERFRTWESQGRRGTQEIAVSRATPARGLGDRKHSAGMRVWWLPYQHTSQHTPSFYGKGKVVVGGWGVSSS